MKYTKPALTFDDQARQLVVQRRLQGDPDSLRAKLEVVSYYRLSAYWHAFKQADETLKPGTTVDLVWSRYTFDRTLRLLVLDAIERAEIAIRTRIVYEHAAKHGPFGYLNPLHLPRLAPDAHALFLDKLRKEARFSEETFVDAYFKKYDEETDLPLWMLCELMSFGHMFTLYRGLEPRLKSAVADHFGVPDEVLFSWLRALNTVRNICAHHGRLWNRELGTQPAIPRRNKHPDWHQGAPIRHHRIFAIMSVLRYLMERLCPESHWQARFESLLAQHPDIPLADMGFPENWKQSPIWSPAA